jgi:hypothetical protein
MELHEARQPRLVEELQAANRRISSPGSDRGRRAGRSRHAPEKSFADEQRGDAVSEADLNRLRRTFASNPLPQRLPLGCANGDREQRVERPIRARNRGTVTNQALDHLSHPSPGRATTIGIRGLQGSRLTRPALGRRAGGPSKESSSDLRLIGARSVPHWLARIRTRRSRSRAGGLRNLRGAIRSRPPAQRLVQSRRGERRCPALGIRMQP